MKADNDKFIESLRRKLDNYEEPVDDSAWQSITRDLEKLRLKKRMRKFAISVSSVAACIALIVVALFSTRDNQVALMPETTPIASKATPHSDNAGTPHDREISANEPPHIAATQPERPERPERAEKPLTVATAPVSGSVEPIAATDSTSSAAATQPAERRALKTGKNDKTTRSLTATKESRPQEYYARHSDMPSKRNQSGKFGASLKVDNGLMAQNSSNGGFMPINKQMRPVGPVYTSNGNSGFSSSYAEMMANNIEQPTRTDLQFDIPITVSASFRYNFTKRWGIDAGLSFTRMGASWKSGSDAHYYRSKQKTYFIGIPVGVNFTIFDSRYFSFYALVGGSVEKCVAGNVSTSLVGGLEGADTSTKEELKEHPWLFSASAGLGLQFNITKRYGIFAEPKVTYFFDTADDIILRKDNSPQFNLSVGMRFNY